MKKEKGKVTREADGFKVRFERVFNHNIHAVWDAITDTEKMKYWFTNIEMELKPGAPMTIWFRDEARTPTHGKVVKIEKPHRFEWMWETELAVWELFEEGKDKCKLIFT